MPGYYPIVYVRGFAFTDAQDSALLDRKSSQRVYRLI
jgi:hypothetical protein